MAVQAPIVINDGLGVPVAHTFAARGARTEPTGKLRAIWRENSTINAEGDLSIVEHYVQGSGPDGLEKFTWVISVPTLQVVGTNDLGFTPPAQKAYECVGVIECRFPRRSTLVERGNIAAFIKNFAATAYMENAIELRDPAS